MSTYPHFNRPRSLKHRLGPVVAALGLLAATATAVTISDAQSTQRPMTQRTGRGSAAQLARQIRTFEAKGYAPTSCTVSGTLMRNFSTGQSVTVKW